MWKRGRERSGPLIIMHEQVYARKNPIYKDVGKIQRCWHANVTWGRSHGRDRTEDQSALEIHRKMKWTLERKGQRNSYQTDIEEREETRRKR